MPNIPRRRVAESVTCPGCGSATAKVVQRSGQLTEPDVEGDFRFDITQCDVCGEELLSFEQSEDHARSYAAAVARARGTMSPERIAQLRHALGYSQAAMEEAFGVGPKTWGRWERGLIAPTGPAARLMWLAEKDRPEFMRLVDAHQRHPTRSVKVVGSIAPGGIGETAVAFHIASTGPRREETFEVGRSGPTSSGGVT